MKEQQKANDLTLLRWVTRHQVLQTSMCVQWGGNISSCFYEANASELLEYFEEMFPCYLVGQKRMLARKLP